MLKTQERFKSKSYVMVTEDANKIALNSNDDKKIQSIDSTERHAYQTSKDLINEKEEINCNFIINQYTQ